MANLCMHLARLDVLKLSLKRVICSMLLLAFSTFRLVGQVQEFKQNNILEFTSTSSD